MSRADQLDQTARVVVARRRQEMTLLVAWQNALADLEGAVAKQDRLAARQDRSVPAILGMRPAEVRWARHHARKGQYPTTVASRVNYAAYVHHRKRIEAVEALWAKRITAIQIAVDEAAATLCEATRALLSGTTAQTVEELTGLTRRQVAGLARRASALRLSGG
ncbi:MAG: hypothetical protein ACYC1D_05935 [Acidimicrobiales bacterium]